MNTKPFTIFLFLLILLSVMPCGITANAQAASQKTIPVVIESVSDSVDVGQTVSIYVSHAPSGTSGKIEVRVKSWWIDKTLATKTYDASTDRSGLWKLTFTATSDLAGVTIGVFNDYGLLYTESESSQVITVDKVDNTLIFYLGGDTSFWDRMIDRVLGPIHSLTATLTTVKDYVVGLPSTIYDFVTNSVEGAFTSLKNDIVAWIGGLSDWITTLITNTADKVGVASPVVGAGVAVVGGIGLYYAIKLVLYIV